MTIVIDSNIAVASSLADEPLYSKANQILRFWHKVGERLIAPQLWRSEVTAVIRKAVFQERVSANEGQEILAGLLLYPIQFYEDNELLIEAYKISVRFNQPRAYDTQYVALAERFSAEFWTTDKRLVNSVQTQNAQIRWLGDWNAPDA